MSDDERVLSRDLNVTLIPSGTPMTLAKGETVTITHRLGGNFTVMTSNGMFRIGGADADAIGETVEEQDMIKTEDSHLGPVDKDLLWEALKTVFDPEIPVNIVDLGLIYTLECTELESGGNRVEVEMTLTAPGCGMGPTIAEDARSRIASVPGVAEASVEIIMHPPWNQDMITEEGRMVLGLV